MKRRVVQSVRNGHFKLSRAFCAGLIEAIEVISRPTAAALLSRAFCAGLIEATGVLDEAFAAAIVIPCVLRGPH